jgi:hypothetical protein
MLVRSEVSGADSVTFERDLLVDVEPYRMFWYKTNGHIAGLPTEHPGILIQRDLPA